MSRLGVLEDTLADCMNSISRIAARYVFESRVLIRFCRGSQKLAAQGWARDLSESGLGAFVLGNLVIGELVTLEIPIGSSGKEVMAAKGVLPGGNAIWIPIHSAQRRTTAGNSRSIERTERDSIPGRKNLITPRRLS